MAEPEPVSVVIDCTSGMARIGEPGEDEKAALAAARLGEQMRMAAELRESERRRALARLKIRACLDGEPLTTDDLQDLLMVLGIREGG